MAGSNGKHPAAAGSRRPKTDLDPAPVTARARIVRSSLKSVIGREVDLTGDVVWFGREEGNEVVVADPTMSGRHAWLEIAGGDRFTLHDNQSSNGIFIKGRQVGEAELAPGQRFQLGATTFELVCELESPEPEAAPGSDGAVPADGDEDETVRIAQRSLLEELGEPVVVAANRPFLISDPASVWLVETGKVEIFTVAVDKGQPVGSRSHFITVEPGAVFFGLDTETGSFDDGFLAVGKAGAGLRRFAIERFRLCAPVVHYRRRLAAMVDGWVAVCARRLTSDLPKIPPSELVLQPAQEAELPLETVIATGRKVLWIELPAARLMFDGMAGLSYESEGALFPLAPGSWIELLSSDTAVEVIPMTTEEVIDDPRLWAGLGLFHRLMECELLNKKLAMVEEFHRQQRKAERAEQAREVAISEIKAVLGGARRWQRPSYEGSELGSVFRAAELVARHGGVAIRLPASDLEGLSFEDTVLAIAAESNFRVRQVALLDDWWKREQGAMLGQLEEGKKPVAILPQRRGSAISVDPESGDSQNLDEERAAGLEPFAYSFYRTFPDGPLQAMDLVRFAAAGLRREFRDVVLMGIGVGILSTVPPAITGLVFDRAIPEAERPLLLQLCLGLFLMALSMSAFKVTQNVAVLRVQSKMDYSTQAAVWDRLLNLPMTFFRRYSAGDLADRADAVNEIRGIVAGTGVSAILGSFASLFNAVQMCFYSFTLAAVGIVLTVLYVAMTAILNIVKLRFQRLEMRQRGGLSGLVLQLISGVSKLRVSGAEDHAFRVWATDFAAMRRTAFGAGRIANVMPMLNRGFPVLSSLAIFFTMFKLQQSAVTKGETFDLSTGDFLAFSAAFGIFLAAMQALGGSSVEILGAIPVWERLRPILEQQAEVDSSKAAPAQLRGAIELSNVHFQYTPEGPSILRGLALEIAAGEFVAFVGGSGCGKSTLMKVMLGFEQPQQGSVYYDGQDLSTLDARRVRQQIGVVLQESRLIPADIYRNIVGNSSRTIADAWEAAHKAGLAEDINRMPMQMHTYVSEGGGGFSGGQKQRLMIARALVHSPKILFLDEATSALDNRTQAIVTESLDRLQATRIVIAHRLSTIMGADKICYLEGGVIAEQGTFDELMEKDGLFAELARRQLA